MATRSFTVFQDTTASDKPVTVSKPVRASSRVLARSATKSTTTSNHLPGSLNELAVAIDKENYDPLTGLRANATVPKNEKLKRKTSVQGSSVLSLKAHASAATATKKLKTSNISNGATTEPEAKKRRTLTASTTASRAKVKTVTTKKEGSGLGSSKLPTRSTTSSTQGRKTKRTSPTLPLRKASAPLPKVDEQGSVAVMGTSEPMPQPKLTKTLSQAAIDSRCYELTVSPLADVSEAYDASPLRPESEEVAKPKTSKPKPEEDIFRTVREPSAEPELRDYFTVDSFNTALASSRVLSRLSEEPEEKQKQSASSLFSTPERQKLYMSFTFSSPSPSGKRFRDTYGTYGSKQGSPTRSNVKAPGLLSPVAESPVATRVQ